MATPSVPSPPPPQQQQRPPPRLRARRAIHACTLRNQAQAPSPSASARLRASSRRQCRPAAGWQGSGTARCARPLRECRSRCAALHDATERGRAPHDPIVSQPFAGRTVSQKWWDPQQKKTAGAQQKRHFQMSSSTPCVGHGVPEMCATHVEHKCSLGRCRDSQ